MLKPLTIEDICKKLKPIFKDKVNSLYLKYTLTDSKEKKKEIEQALKVLYEKHLNSSLLDEKILLEPPEENTINGQYKLGNVTYANKELYTFGLREKDLIRHICITGMSGSGKTMLAFNLLQQIIQENKPFIVFDWKKSYRSLLNLNKNILCFTIGNNKISNFFKININKPPEGISPKEWISILCDLITESFFASFGVHKILTEILDKTFKDFGVYRGTENYPTWYDIRKRLEEKYEETQRRGRESEWLESALRIAYALTYGSFGESINSKEEFCYKVEDILNKKVIFELNLLNNSQKKFFCEFVLNYIYLLKKLEDSITNNLKTTILVDEAHNIFLKDRPIFLKESTTDKIYREIREYGIGLICVDQHISKLSEVVVGNSATHLIMQQMLPKDISIASELMQLKDHKNYFTMLPVGYSICKLAERHFFPFTIKVPLNPLREQTITDNEIKERMEKSTKIRKIIKKLIKQNLEEFNLKKEKTLKEENEDKEFDELYLKKIKDFLDKEKKAYIFLKYLKKHQPEKTINVYKSLTLSARKGTQIKRRLISLGLINETEKRNKKGRSKLLKLNKLALKFI